MSFIELQEIQRLCVVGNIIWKDHAAKRLKERRISTYDVEKCIATGEIIEQYPTDYPVPSCLILGMSISNFHLHVVCSIHQGYVCIITSYFPSLDDWENDYKTRKAVK